MRLDCHEHVLPARVSTYDPESRQRAFLHKVDADHARWAKWKQARKRAHESRRRNRGR